MLIHRFFRLGLICLVSITVLSCEKKTEDCVDEVAKKASTEEGVRRGIENCYVRNSVRENNEAQGKHSDVVVDCHLTWNGESFVKGIPAELSNYFIVGFPNATSLAYLPKNMSKEIGEQLIHNNWELIKAICPAIKASELK